MAFPGSRFLNGVFLIQGGGYVSLPAVGVSILTVFPQMLFPSVFKHTLRVEKIAPREVSSAKDILKRTNGLKWVNICQIWMKIKPDCRTYPQILNFQTIWAEILNSGGK